MNKFTVESSESFNSLKQQLESAQSKLEQLNSTLTSNRSFYRQQQEEMSSMNKQRDVLKDQLRDKQLKYQSVTQYTELKHKVDKDIVDVQNELNELSSSAPLNVMRNSHSTSQSVVEKQISQVQSDMASIDSSVKEIRRFVENEKEQQLEEAQNKMEKIKIIMKQYDQDVGRLETEKNEKVDVLSKQAEVELIQISPIY